ncbi:hypothetical protein GH733_015147 [Mirounga leonina]|nr:hypothetical protein GH733_015147 [Mirounga leonina]
MNKLHCLPWPTPSCGRGASAHGAGLYHPHRDCPGASLSVLHCLPLHRPLASVLTFYHERFCLISQPCEELGEKTEFLVKVKGEKATRDEALICVMAPHSTFFDQIACRYPNTPDTVT